MSGDGNQTRLTVLLLHLIVVALVHRPTNQVQRLEDGVFLHFNSNLASSLIDLISVHYPTRADELPSFLLKQSLADDVDVTLYLRSVSDEAAHRRHHVLLAYFETVVAHRVELRSQSKHSLSSEDDELEVLPQLDSLE